MIPRWLFSFYLCGLLYALSVPAAAANTRPQAADNTSIFCNYESLREAFASALQQSQKGGSATSLAVFDSLAEGGFMPAQYALYRLQEKNAKASAQRSSAYFWLILAAAGYDSEALKTWREIFKKDKNDPIYQEALKKTRLWLPHPLRCPAATKPAAIPYPLDLEIEGRLAPTGLEELPLLQTKEAIAEKYLKIQKQKEAQDKQRELLAKSRLFTYDRFILTVDPSIDGDLVGPTVRSVEKALVYIQKNLPRAWFFLQPVEHIHIFSSLGSLRAVFFQQAAQKSDILFLSYAFAYDQSPRTLARTIAYYVIDYAYKRLEAGVYAGPFVQRKGSVHLFGTVEASRSNTAFFHEASLAIEDFHQLPPEIQNQLAPLQDIYYTPVSQQDPKDRGGLPPFMTHWEIGVQKAPQNSFPLFITRPVLNLQHEKILLALVENLFTVAAFRQRQGEYSQAQENKEALQSLAPYSPLTQGYMDLLQTQTQKMEEKSRKVPPDIHCRSLELEVEAARALHYPPAILADTFFSTDCAKALNAYRLWLEPPSSQLAIAPPAPKAAPKKNTPKPPLEKPSGKPLSNLPIMPVRRITPIERPRTIAPVPAGSVKNPAPQK